MTKSSNFSFLSAWQDIAEIYQRALTAEKNIGVDPRTSGFYARNTLELMVHTVFEIDNWISAPRHDTTLMSLIHEPSFKKSLPYHLFPKLKLIIKIGNEAVHSRSAIPQRAALQGVIELHHVLFWFMRTYAPKIDRKTFRVLDFDEARIPTMLSVSAQVVENTVKKIKALEKELAEKDSKSRDDHAKLLKENAQIKAENEAYLKTIEASKLESKQIPDDHDYNEEETRRVLIDGLLHEAGWALNDERDREYVVSGMPISRSAPKGGGRVDYVLWGDDGKALAVVEAKRTSVSPEAGQIQAKLYAKCLEKECGVRPIIYYSNGDETRIWDDVNYPPRSVRGFHSKRELMLMIKRRGSRVSFFNGGHFSASVDNDISNRHYQKSAITHILEHFEIEHGRKALLVMATGTGKTRTVISLVDLMTKHNWIKNVLFLADRNALLDQAKKNFVNLLPRISCSILDASVQKGSIDSRLFFSTYPTMKNLLDKSTDDRPFGIGHFDLVVVDEAHRSVYSKYREIFNYFDSFLVGLTATPKEDVGKNTYGIFDLQDGDPTYAYEDASAYAEKYLVPPAKISVTTKFVREGIKYQDLSEDDQTEWEEKEELAGRDEVLPTELNTFLFNKDTARKMFAQLMTPDELGGIHVEGGDVIAKTIIFSANNDHAEFLQKVFDENYPKFKGKLAQVITYKSPYAQSLIDAFTEEGKPFDRNNPDLRIAISVDMLDTGIDAPEVCNLVFFKVIRSHVKFTQMLGRGTRLCENLFGPGDHKKGFRVFDYCQNFEYFNENPKGAKESMAKPLSEQVFEKRVMLSRLLAEQLKQQTQTLDDDEIQALSDLRTYQLDMLHHQVVGMNLDNFIVRPKRKYVEPFLKREAWELIDDNKHNALEGYVSSLPTEADAFNADEVSNELSNRFDHLILSMQLNVIENGKVSDNHRARVMEFAQKLEAKTNIPAVLEQLPLIQEIQSLEFWQMIDLPTLELVRIKLRNLMTAIDKEDRVIVYTNFEDEVLGVKELPADYSVSSMDLSIYRKKTELYIKDHQDHLTIQKLKRNKPITQLDLDNLETLLLKASGVDDVEQYRKEVLQEKPLGSFIRELVGLDMNAAKEAFSDFLDEGKYNAEQINFVNQIINYLMSNGVLEMKHIFEPPFTNLHHESVYGFFDEDKVTVLIGRIKTIKSNAIVLEESA